MSTETIERTEIDPTTGKGRVSHIVKPKDGKTASVLVMEARIYGGNVEALCGHVWSPARDARNYPVCQKCKELWEFIFGSDFDMPADT
jgi:hypothetical protein